jgi:UDP-galactopyranose mutase
MVWADRFHHAYTKSGGESAARGLSGYDPMKFQDHTLGKGIRFQVYPKDGWNAVWDAMVARSTVVRDRVVRIEDEHRKPYVLLSSGEKHYFGDYHTVFCSIDIDELWGENRLPYTGRMMIPLLIPGLAQAFPEGAESLHYSSCEFQTRVTEMKVITRHESPDTLILIEVPILPGAIDAFPRNTIDYALENNLFAAKAYPQQSAQAFGIYDGYVERGKKIPNLRYVGRHAEFKYWGMPETVHSAYEKSLEFPPV